MVLKNCWWTTCESIGTSLSRNYRNGNKYNSYEPYQQNLRKMKFSGQFNPYDIIKLVQGELESCAS